MIGKLLEKIKSLFEFSRVRIIISAALFVVLTVLFFVFGGFSLKHLVYVLFFAAGSAVLILLKRLPLKLSFVVLAVYVLAVPFVLFKRMELPVGTLDFMSKKGMLLSVLLIYCLWIICFIFSQRIGLALAIGNILIFISTAVEYYVAVFRGVVVSFEDFKLMNTMVSVWGNYDYTPSSELYYSFVWFLFFILLAFKLGIGPKEIREKYPKYPALPVHIAGSIVGAAVSAGFLCLILATPFLENHGFDDSHISQVSLDRQYGWLSYPFVEYRMAQIYAPLGYGPEKLKEIADNADREFDPIRSSTDDRPNIIFIMNEALSDVRYLGNIETNEPVMPYLDSLYSDEHAIRGKLYTPVLGGMTVNTEFEALTGFSTRFLPTSVIPYMGNIKADMPSLCYELESLGYDSMAVHPNMAVAYGRDEVYGHFGFDEFISFENQHYPADMEEKHYTSDKVNYDELIYRYENRSSDNPLFIFDVTIQNHSPYWNKDRQMRITQIGEESGDFGDMFCQEETYLDLVKRSDEAFKYLTDYFSNVDEPTVICMFGDHEAIHTDEFYNKIFAGRDLSETEKMQLKYITPYVIWTNYDIELKDFGDFSANYLGAVLLEELGLPMSDFRKVQMSYLERYPILSGKQITDGAGITLEEDVKRNDERLADYKMFQYNAMYSEEIDWSLFTPKEYTAADVQSGAVLKDWQDYTAIAHALGETGDGIGGTNSLEAFLYSYKKGYKVFEGDLRTAADGKIILRHDWTYDFGQAESFGWNDETEHRIPTSEEFLNTPIYGKYTPLSLEEWFAIMHEHPDIWFVTDTKEADSMPEYFKAIVDTAIDNGYEDVLKRVIVQLYYQDMYDEVDQVYHFDNYILTLYYSGYPEDPSEMIDFLETKGIKGLTMPYTTWDEKVKDDLKDMHGFEIYLHTVNDTRDAKRLLEDVDGLYTDCITEKQMERMKY